MTKRALPSPFKSEVPVLPGPPPNKINGLTDILATVATAIGDRFYFYTLRKLALPAVRFRGDADMTGALNRLDLSKVTHLCHSVINFVALHIIEFYFHDLRISDHRPIAAAEQGGACNLPPLLGCIAQSSFQSRVEIAPHLRHALIAILAEERRRPVVF